MFKAQGIITKVSTMADGGYRVQVDTNELRPEAGAELMSLHKQFGSFAFAPEGKSIEEKDLEIPDEQKEFPNQKTLSERLRAVLYVYWGKRGAKGDFEDFRRKQMEALIDHFKQKIDES